MKNFETARKIFYALNEKGAELGNASVVIIEDVLDKRDAALEAENKELREALEEIANGPFGKSVAVKNIARAVLAKYEVKA